MKTIETLACVTDDHRLLVEIPLGENWLPGPRRIVVVLENELADVSRKSVVGSWGKYDSELTDPTNTFRREDIYGDDGR
jgi:hypothetical protein